MAFPFSVGETFYMASHPDKFQPSSRRLNLLHLLIVLWGDSIVKSSQRSGFDLLLTSLQTWEACAGYHKHGSLFWRTIYPQHPSPPIFGNMSAIAKAM